MIPGYDRGRGPGTPSAAVLNFHLTVPNLKMGKGFFTFDPVKALLGKSIAETLGSALAGPVQRVQAVGGGWTEVYPIRLEDGLGVSLTLKSAGELGFGNDGGSLKLIVPLVAEPWLRTQLGEQYARAPEVHPSLDGNTSVLWVWLSVRAGMSIAIPVKGLGQVGVSVV